MVVFLLKPGNSPLPVERGPAGGYSPMVGFSHVGKGGLCIQWEGLICVTAWDAVRGPWGQDPDILPRLQQSSSQLTLVLPNAGDQALVHKCVTQWAGRSAAALSP